jgi:hypothetical protein
MLVLYGTGMGVGFLVIPEQAAQMVNVSYINTAIHHPLCSALLISLIIADIRFPQILENVYFLDKLDENVPDSRAGYG